jgi:hypothetical protein
MSRRRFVPNAPESSKDGPMPQLSSQLEAHEDRLQRLERQSGDLLVDITTNTVELSHIKDEIVGLRTEFRSGFDKMSVSLEDLSKSLTENQNSHAAALAELKSKELARATRWGWVTKSAWGAVVFVVGLAVSQLVPVITEFVTKHIH